MAKDKRRPREVSVTKQFRKDLERARSHKKCDLVELRDVMARIENREALDAAQGDHMLRGKYPEGKQGKTDCRECHASNDWLLIYRLPDDDSVTFIRTGTHSDLF